MSLPLLEGLSRRPSASKSIVEEALRQFTAGKRIARWTRRRWTRTATRAPPLSRAVSEHWLWKSLQSSSPQDRISGCRILLQGLPPRQLDYATVEVIHRLQLWLTQKPHSTTASLTWIALLQQYTSAHAEFCQIAIVPWLAKTLSTTKCQHTLVALLEWWHVVARTPTTRTTVLAHLIQTWHVWNAHPAKGKHLDAALARLHQWMDPTSSTTTVTARTSSLPPASNTVERMFAAVYGSDEDEEAKPSDDEDDEEEEEAPRDVDMEDAVIENTAAAVADDDETMEEAHEDHQAPHEEEDAHHDEDDDENDDDDDDDDEEEEEDHGRDEEDEEIDSDEAEDHDVVFEEEEHDIVIHDDDVARLQEGILEFSEAGPAEEDAAAKPQKVTEQTKERERSYIQASMQVLAAQHHHHHHHQHTHKSHSSTAAPLLSPSSEETLLKSMMNIIQPPKKPSNTKILLRRAPTQEEFFRGSLSTNPISISMLDSSDPQASEPTVQDLRQYIADDLQMSDSAELLELLVANKILDVGLKLRVIHQVVWRNHLIESSHSSTSLSSVAGPSIFSTGSGLSMIFSSGLRESIGGSRNITAETPLSSLPAMVVTYRLAGVDGEATEDTVSELVDPEAPADCATAEEKEKLLEQEFGITRLATDGRGVFVLLRSIENHIADVLRRIRRDDIEQGPNPSRIKFRSSPPYPGLTLLRCCSKLQSNRKKLLQARAPTILLRLLLETLHALEEPGEQQHQLDSAAEAGTNPTAELLQELIEVLASDISTVTPTTQATSEDEEDAGFESDAEQDASTLPILLSSIETIFLSSALRKVIAKLLPFLTYGQVALSRELARNFSCHVSVDLLAECESKERTLTQSSALMDTFVQSSIHLPANEVCNSLRSELINCGFIKAIADFIMRGLPLEPPPWSPGLRSKAQVAEAQTKEESKLDDAWRIYFQRGGLSTAFQMLTGVCKQHEASQTYIAGIGADDKDRSFLLACHWIEATSDKPRISMNGLGLLAETFLDEVRDGNEHVTKLVNAVRRKTRERKREIANERRNRALVNMSTFGPLAGAASVEAAKQSQEESSSSLRGMGASILAPVLGFFRDSASPTNAASGPSRPADTSQRSTRRKSKKQDENTVPAKPAWMAEMEGMEDETGLTCAVCQEGRTLQPSELLGLYAYVKKVSIPLNLSGGRSSIEGAILLASLPVDLPESVVGSHAALEWFPAGKAAGEELKETTQLDSSLSSNVPSSRRATYFTTTVSAGNAIHFSCHQKARQADRSHPKAPKNEWEGACLRNSRVSCNVILPLVSSRSSKVPLMAVDSALTDHQTAVSNLLGARPKSMLWTCLHDVRLLLLRMSYGESLNADCGGGSLASNAQLCFYQMLVADMFEKDAQVDAPGTAQHARALSAGYLAACEIVNADDFQNTTSSSTTALLRGVADAAPMAAICCVLFHNTRDDYNVTASKDDDEENSKPHPKRRWVVGRELFLRGLVRCAGRRHALGIDTSGCTTGRNANQKRPTSFADWEEPSEPRRKTALGKRSLKPSIDDFSHALRPMIAFFAILDQLSAEFVLNMDDSQVEESANRLVEVIERCQRAKSIHELLRKANVCLDHDQLIDDLQKGMISA